MKLFPGRFFLPAASFTLLLCSASSAPAASDPDDREVRISFVQGDVRLSRGNGKHTDLNKPWEQAEEGTVVEQGFAIATGNGRAEIEFEYGSTVYLAENSLLLFRELSAPRDSLVTRLALPTGTGTFALQPADGESFFIETPTDKLQISPPEKTFMRIDAYLDATAITPQSEKGETVVGDGRPDLNIPKGQTVFFQGGEIVEDSYEARTRLDSNAQNLRLLFNFLQLVLAEELNAPVLGPPTQRFGESQNTAAGRYLANAEWDDWTSAREQERAATTTAALRTSGLSSPVPGLNDLYARGTFFDCQPYGTCWEPTQQEPALAAHPQASPPSTQSPVSNAPNSGFQPQTVEWMRTNWGDCGLYSSKRISRVAHTSEELNELLRRKAQDERNARRGASYSTSCEYGAWIYARGHYARVLTHRIPHRCLGANCKHVHPPHPIWVRVAGKVGFVPRHPNDVKGKPPINLKNGIIVPPAKPGESAQRLTVDPSQKLRLLDKPPSEFLRQPFEHLSPVSAPQIQAHLMQEAAGGKSLGAAARSNSHIVYDYKTQKFMMPATVAAGAKAREVPVGGIASSGKVASFADGRSGRYADSFARTSAATSYSGGSRSAGSYSGGGHSSGSYSGGGHASGSYSSGGYSGGSSSHSSGGSSGGGGPASSAAGSSSSSSGASNGRSH